MLIAPNLSEKCRGSLGARGKTVSRNWGGLLGVIPEGSFAKGEQVMTEIQEGNRVVTQITTVKLPPNNQDEVLNLMTARAFHGAAAWIRFNRTAP